MSTFTTCLIVAGVIYAMGLLLGSLNIPDELPFPSYQQEYEKKRNKTIGKVIFWPCYLSIWLVTIILLANLTFFRFIGKSIKGFFNYLKEDFINETKEIF